ncbi:MAG: winged helix-turn-helix domain-containing protein [Burkholderiales bacterium]|jgi:two-component system OmpR family response regulator/two-component system response regulator RstA
MQGARILLVEDDERLAQLVSAALAREGFQVEHCARGDEAPARILSGGFDLVLLDGHLPGKDGFEVLREVRGRFAGRIAMLTARDDDIDQVLGLEGGADDYLAKPVAPRVLLARVRALLRRDAAAPAALRFGPLLIRPEAREVRLHDQPVALTTAEYDLLAYLAGRAGQVVSRDDIMQALRGLEFDGLDRAIDARISRLRRRIGDDPANPTRIRTVRGQGYLFMPD